MQITLTLTFTASCDRVADMLIDPSFAEYVGKEINAENVTTTSIPKGLTAVYTVAAPEKAGRILGSQMTLTETVLWDDDGDPDGSRTGRLTITISGVPASATGGIRLAPTPTGSTMAYDADFTIRIPLIGKKLEQMTQQYLTQIITACEKVGNQWLNPDPQ